MRITVKYCSASSWSLSSFSWTPISRLSLERHQQSVNLCCCCWLTTTAGAAKAPLSQIPADNSDGNFVVFFWGFFGSIKLISSNLRSSWFWLSMPSLKSSRWLISCLSAFSDERITDTCWFCIFSSLWLRLRLWISCSRRELRLATCAADRDDKVRGRRYEPKWK